MLPEIVKSYKEGLTDDEIIKILVKKLKPYAIKNRLAFKVTKIRKKKLEKAVKNSSENVGTFQRLLVDYRKSINHKRVKLIDVGDSQYNMLKDIVANADEFIKIFELNKIVGYNEYIKRFFMLLEKRVYGINKFKFYNEKIFESYEAITIMNDDLKSLKNKENTLNLYSIWQELMAQYTDEKGEIDNEEQFLNFVFARQEADGLDADYTDYLKAQFEKLQSYGYLPEMGALFGDNARKRYKSYMYKRGIKKKNKGQLLDKNLTDDQRRYMEIRDRRSQQ